MDNNQSAELGELAKALSKAQGQITGALKDSSNPFFKSKYADLASCWEACRKQLTDNELSVIQTTTTLGTEEALLVTTLLHSSGQWIRGVLPIKAKDDGPQAQGSGITYARRYALAAIVGLAQIDDDAEAAQARDKPASKATKTRNANKHAELITTAAMADNLPAVKELVLEGKSGEQEFWVNVWQSLPTNVKHYIRDNMEGQN